MKVILLILLSFSVLHFSMCRVQKTPETSVDLRIYFGSGGGFTGFVNEYCLLKDGTFFNKAANSEEWIYHSKIDKKTASQYFRQVELTEMFNIHFNQPSNRYFFIRVKDRHKENKITWGDALDSSKSKVPDSRVKVLYSILNDHIAKTNIKNRK